MSLVENEKAVRELRRRGFGVDCFGQDSRLGQPRVLIKGTLAQTMSLMEEIRAKQFSFKSDYNRDTCREELLTKSRDRIEFKGGTHQELVDAMEGRIDMTPFLEAREKLEKSGLLRNLQAEVQKAIPKRKRFVSEHDGEWDLDRKWEISPFMNTTRALSPGRVIEIDASFSISAWTKSEAIDKYGAFVWAISDLIEQAGYKTRVTWFNLCQGVDKRRSFGNRLEIEVKKPDAYMSPSVLAAAFKANFFRRVGFAMLALTADVGSGEADCGLGSPIAEREPIRYDKGRIVVGPDSPQVDAATIEKVILDALGMKKAAA